MVPGGHRHAPPLHAPCRWASLPLNGVFRIDGKEAEGQIKTGLAVTYSKKEEVPTPLCQEGGRTHSSNRRVVLCNECCAMSAVQRVLCNECCECCAVSAVQRVLCNGSCSSTMDSINTWH